MPIDTERLLSIARGEIAQNSVVVGVKALATSRLTSHLTPKEPRITPITPITRKINELPKQSFLGEVNGVKEDVIAPVGASFESSRLTHELSHIVQKACCVCGDNHASFGVNFHWHKPDKARWYCSKHYQARDIS